MRQSHIIRIILPAFVFLLVACGVSASTPFPQKIGLTHGFYHRSPDSVGFKLFDDEQTIESGSIITVKPSFSAPLATETKIVCGSHTVSFFPGATVKILAEGLQPLSGRIEILSEAATEPIAIRTARFSGEIYDGHLLLEVTPDDGTFIAMRNRGQAWFKDRTRKIFELENGHELHFPLFGPAVEMPVLSGFWSDQPGSFSSARKKSADGASSFDQKSVETSEIASDTVTDSESDAASGSEKLDASGIPSASTADVSSSVMAD